MQLNSLPIDTLKAEILLAFKVYNNLIIKASPGSGKTTRLPLYLLEQTDKKIYILEPRRLAAKLACLQVARELNEEVGVRVGYIFRFERKISSETRIFFLTEGTFLKMMGNDPTLKEASVVIIDEFHERHLTTDAALSFVTKIQRDSRPDLKIILMSATIDTVELETYLNNFSQTKILSLDINLFPLDVHYLPNTTNIIQSTLEKKVFNYK